MASVLVGAAVAVAAVVAVRAVKRAPESSASRESVERQLVQRIARPDGTPLHALEELVDSYVQDFGGTPEVRWFAVAAYLRLGKVERAAGAVWEPAEVRLQPGSAARFARLFLQAHAAAGDIRFVIPLAEAGDHEALSVVVASALEPEETALAAVRELQRARSSVIPSVVEALRASPAPSARWLAALLSHERGRAEDVPVLLALAEGPARHRLAPVRARALLSLGTTELAAAIDALRRGASGATPDSAADGDPSPYVCALAAAGEPDAIARLVEAPGTTAVDAPFAALAADALIHRRLRGDDEATRALVVLWDRGGDPEALRRIAEAALLPGGAPAGDGRGDVLAERVRAGLPGTDPALAVLDEASRVGVDPLAVDALMQRFLVAPARMREADVWVVRWIAARALLHHGK